MAVAEEKGPEEGEVHQPLPLHQRKNKKKMTHAAEEARTTDSRTVAEEKRATAAATKADEVLHQAQIAEKLAETAEALVKQARDAADKASSDATDAERKAENEERKAKAEVGGGKLSQAAREASQNAEQAALTKKKVGMRATMAEKTARAAEDKATRAKREAKNAKDGVEEAKMHASGAGQAIKAAKEAAKQVLEMTEVAERDGMWSGKAASKVKGDVHEVNKQVGRATSKARNAVEEAEKAAQRTEEAKQLAAEALTLAEDALERAKAAQQVTETAEQRVRDKRLEKQACLVLWWFLRLFLAVFSIVAIFEIFASHDRPQILTFEEAHAVGNTTSHEQVRGRNQWKGLLPRTSFNGELDTRLRADLLMYGELAQAAYDGFEGMDKSHACYGSVHYGHKHLLPSLTQASWSKLYERYEIRSADDYLCAPTPWSDVVHKFFQSDEDGPSVPRGRCQSDGDASQAKGCEDKCPDGYTWIGYIAVSTDEERGRDVVVAFRGTVLGSEWLNNLALWKSYETVQALRGNNHGSSRSFKVHPGFFDMYTNGTRALKEVIRERLTGLVEEEAGNVTSITFVGHSLGGALATLAAEDIGEMREDLPLWKNISLAVYTFAAPRVGDFAFKVALQQLNVPVLNVVVKGDVVPCLPPRVANKDAIWTSPALWLAYRVVGRYIARVATSAILVVWDGDAVIHNLVVWLRSTLASKRPRWMRALSINGAIVWLETVLDYKMPSLFRFEDSGVTLFLDLEHSPEIRLGMTDLAAHHNLEVHLFLLSSQYSSASHRPIYRDAALLNKHGGLLNEKLAKPHGIEKAWWKGQEQHLALCEVRGKDGQMDSRRIWRPAAGSTDEISTDDSSVRPCTPNLWSWWLATQEVLWTAWWVAFTLPLLLTFFGSVVASHIVSSTVFLSNDGGFKRFISGTACAMAVILFLVFWVVVITLSIRPSYIRSRCLRVWLPLTLVCLPYPATYLIRWGLQHLEPPAMGLGDDSGKELMRFLASERQWNTSNSLEILKLLQENDVVMLSTMTPKNGDADRLEAALNREVKKLASGSHVKVLHHGQKSILAEWWESQDRFHTSSAHSQSMLASPDVKPLVAGRDIRFQRRRASRIKLQNYLKAGSVSQSIWLNEAFECVWGVLADWRDCTWIQGCEKLDLIDGSTVVTRHIRRENGTTSNETVKHLGHSQWGTGSAKMHYQVYEMGPRITYYVSEISLVEQDGGTNLTLTARFIPSENEAGPAETELKRRMKDEFFPGLKKRFNEDWKPPRARDSMGNGQSKCRCGA